jgi:hypothetical protein
VVLQPDEEALAWALPQVVVALVQAALPAQALEALVALEVLAEALLPQLVQVAVAVVVAEQLPQSALPLQDALPVLPEQAPL